MFFLNVVREENKIEMYSVLYIFFIYFEIFLVF